MARFDERQGRVHLRLVLWGPPGAGASTLLRSIHGACVPGARGGCVAVEDLGEGGAGGFDYALLDLPVLERYRLRLHVLSVPSAPRRADARRRLLADADAVLFVADGSPRGWPANLDAWRELDRSLRPVEAESSPVPVAVVTNRADLADPFVTEGTLPRLWREGARRAVVASGRANALTGEGVLAPFRAAVEQAVRRAFLRRPPTVRGLRAFVESLCHQLGGSDDGSVPRQAAATPAGPRALEDPDLAPWMRLREVELRELERERAWRRLLLDLGALCAGAEHVPGLLKAVLRQVLLNLEGVTGWLGLATPEGEQVMPPTARAAPDELLAVAETVRVLREAAPPGRILPVPAAGLAGLPVPAAAGPGLLATFTAGEGVQGWLLLVLPPDRAVPPEASAVLGPALVHVGLAVQRLRALDELRRANARLEARLRALDGAVAGPPSAGSPPGASPVGFPREAPCGTGDSDDRELASAR